MALEARQLGGRYLVAVLESADCACTGVSVQGMVGSGTGEVCVCVKVEYFRSQTCDTFEDLTHTLVSILFCIVNCRCTGRFANLI